MANKTVTVNIVKAFTLTIVQNGELKKLQFVPGVQDVDEDVANHWYTKAHCGDLPAAVKAAASGKGAA
ncbi:STY1053 family phage-associated protein [Dyella mobilis]|uniref:Phage protein n=1 Tax=Dyella mobilis TaxID=1849582 RepID=A0ABS2KK71_9GAMM|nr:hypothetical protein [Dyella mobilis]MBM7131559.1 hypothetical protein [Dyella mobilis]GLQ96470.1 hypothetical protein GCM10007863_08880 [Dyella mobilis]